MYDICIIRRLLKRSVRFTILREFGRYVMAYLHHWAMYMHEPWSGQWASDHVRCARHAWLMFRPGSGFKSSWPVNVIHIYVALWIPVTSLAVLIWKILRHSYYYKSLGIAGNWSEAISVDRRCWDSLDYFIVCWTNSWLVRVLGVEERTSWVYVCSLVDGDVFESVGEVVPFNVIVGHSVWVLCSSGEVVGRSGPDVYQLSEAVSCVPVRHVGIVLPTWWVISLS